MTVLNEVYGVYFGMLIQFFDGNVIQDDTENQLMYPLSYIQTESPTSAPAPKISNFKIQHNCNNNKCERHLCTCSCYPYLDKV